MDVLKSLPEIIGLIAGFLGVVVSVIAYYYSTRRMLERRKVKIERTRTEIELLKSNVESLFRSIETVEMLPKGNLEVGSLAARLDQLESEMKGFKKLLFDDPEASVTIPLIKKDIDSLKEDNKRLREEMVRMNDFTKWFIGIMITMSIGLFGLAISILLKG
ncbi:MAG: hypothetical protein MUP17_08565 [candidate division Zixibacteria bacterium]|nr:hypothetical protein [candidate division Zixibacteria bacterium]